MIIEKRDNRLRWLIAVASLLFDATIAGLGAAAFKMDVAGAVGLFFALQAVYLAVWLRRTVFAWGWWFLFGKKYLTNRIEAFLALHRFPKPEAFIASASDYLDGVLSNESIDVKIRFAAMGELSAFQLLGSRSQVQELFRLNIAYEAALDEYRRT